MTSFDQAHLPPLHDLCAIGIDIETTGLTDRQPGGLYSGGRILEVGMVIVGPNLAVRAAWNSAVRPVPDVDDLRAQCHPVVREMHDTSGLWDACRTARPLMDVLADAAEWVHTSGVDPRKIPLLGSSVHTDREWLKHGGFAALEGMFHYRNIDVSTVKELAARLYPEWKPDLNPRKLHRAIPDLYDTLDELRYYRDNVFVGFPGEPRLDTARSAVHAFYQECRERGDETEWDGFVRRLDASKASIRASERNRLREENERL